MAEQTPQNPPENNSPESSAERLEMRLPASAAWVRVVRLATAGVASRVGFSYDEVEDIKLAVAEACNNAIIHSTIDPTPGASTPRIMVYWQVLPGGVRISVADEGRLDPPGIIRSTPAADENSDELPESGMGLILIEGLMDKVEHESGPDLDTTIHMTKYLVPEAAIAGRSTPPRPHPDSPVSLRPVRKKSVASDPSQPSR